MVVPDRAFWRWYLVFVLIFSGWYLYQWRNNTGNWFLLAAVSFIVAIIGLILFKKISLENIHLKSTKIPDFLGWAVALILVTVPEILTFLSPTQIVFHESGKFLLLLWMSGVSVLILQSTNRKQLSSVNFLLVILFGGVLFRIGAFVPEIQHAPFSLGWSEGSRYYNASLFFSESIYGEKVALPVLHPSRYLLQAIPFLFNINSIIVHRFWQVLLWIGLVGVGSYSLVKKIGFPNKFIAAIFGMWFFLFFFQGAVYYHLIICMTIVLIGYNREHPWWTTVFVIGASIWTGISRVNWIPVPALLAVTLYLLETQGKNIFWLKYLKYPIIWCAAGGISAILSNRVYAILSGNLVEQFSSSFTSYMIWSRLLPNTTYKPGILLGLLIVILPTFVLALLTIIKNGWKRYYHWVRVIGLFGILFVFGLGGIIVSVKIGGGGDLHNLDAFLVFWLIITSYLFLNRYQLEGESQPAQFSLNFGLFLVAMIIPILLLFQKNPVWEFQDSQKQHQEVIQMQEALDITKAQDGEILFITERQLLSFGYVQNADLEPDYEKVFLMEMVMSNNQPYLEDFHNKLANHEFSAIVMDSLSTKTQTEKDSFWVENNLWVDKVVYPILDYYEPALSFENKTINLMIPRNQDELYNQLKKLGP